jgi:flagella basal body P-ring formation protein FlgA
LFFWLLATPALAGQQNLIDNIRKAIAKELSNTVSGEVEIDRMRIIRGSGNPENLKDYRVVSVVMNGYSGRNRAVFLVHLLDKLNRKRTISVEASYEVVVDVFVTARPIRRGETLTEDDFYAVKQRASRLPVGALLSSKDIAGKSLKVNIGQGVIIRANHITDEQIVRRGQRVNVVVERGNIVITTQGVLISNTAIGDTANVLTDNTRKEISGILVSGDTVRVQL